MKQLKVDIDGEILEGILITENEKTATIKISSGYNAVLKKEDFQILEEKEIDLDESGKEVLEIEKNESLPKILILHTGGTIASKVDYKTGAVSSKFTPKELLAMYPEFDKVVNIDAKMIGNLFSEDMRFAHYNLMLKEIREALDEKNYIGVIISHGTDTLHYTSAALSYSLENLNVPVIIVGAQRSSDRASSDAYSNLNATVNFMIDNSKKDEAFRRVGICMHESVNDDTYLIMDGINAKKLHSSRRDAFKQINYSPFARVDNLGNVEVLRSELLSKKSGDNINYVEYDINLKLGFFKAHPSVNPWEISNLSNYDGVVIEGTGLGHIGVNVVDVHTKVHDENLIALKELCKDTITVMGVQTVYGDTNMNVYSSGRYIQEAGVLGNLMNLTTETLFIRMAYIFSKIGDKDKVRFKEMWEENLEGFEKRNVYVD